MTPEFTRGGLLDALEELATIMESRGEQGRVYVVGGAAMILAHSADRATRDIDATIEHGFAAVTEAARIVAQRRGWPRTWLNEGPYTAVSSRAGSTFSPSCFSSTASLSGFTCPNV